MDCKWDGRAIEISELCAIQFVFMEVFYVSYILRLKLSLNPCTGPNPKARAIQRGKEELLFSPINF